MSCLEESPQPAAPASTAMASQGSYSSCKCLHARQRLTRACPGAMHPQNRAVVNLFRGPNLIEDVAGTMQRLEQGDLKLRVRALDSERALTRVLVRNASALLHCCRIGAAVDECLLISHLRRRSASSRARCYQRANVRLQLVSLHCVGRDGRRKGSGKLH